MPIDLYSSIKKASQWAFGSPLLNGVLGSSLFVACVIAMLMILIIMFMYPAKSGTPFSVVIKMFVYMLFGSLLIIFLHDGVIKYMMEEEFSNKDSEEFMRNTTMQGRMSDPSYAQLYKPIQPKLQETQPIQSQITPVASTAPVTPATQPTTVIASDTITGGGTLNGVKAPKGNTNYYA
jgi:hypothetical protein